MKDGKHILIDFYSCKDDYLNNENILIDGFISGLEVINFPTTEVAIAPQENEFIITAFDTNKHVIMHVYPNLAYIALDFYAFKAEINSSLLMKTIKDFFGAQKVTLTSVNRGNFDSLKDMKPKSKTKVTAKQRVKQTSKKIKKTGLSVLRVITRRKKSD